MKVRTDLPDARFLALAEQQGSPNAARLKTCRKLQKLYLESKGQQVSLWRIAKAKGLIGEGWLERAEAAPASKPTKPSTPSKPTRAKIPSRAKAKAAKARTAKGSKVPTGRQRHRRRSGSDLPLLGALAAVVLVTTGVALGILLRPAPQQASQLAQAEPSPVAAETPTETSWHAHLDALDRGLREDPAAEASAPVIAPTPVAEPEPEPAQAAATSAEVADDEVLDPQTDAAVGAPEPAEDTPREREPEVTLTSGAGASTVLEAAAERSFDAQALLFEVYRHYDAEDADALSPLVSELEALDAPREVSCAQGLLRFLQEDFAGVIAALEPLEDLDGYRERDALARAAMFLGRFDLAREALNPDDPDAQRIAQLLDGPFRTRYPLAAAATEALTPDGHYRVITDLGLPASTLDAFERKLEQTAAGERQGLVDGFRKKHKGLHEVTAVMDKAHRAYTKLFATEPRAKVVPTVFVFSEEADFHGFSSKLNVGSTENTLGYYVPRYRVLVFYDQARGPKVPRIGDETLNVLLHETFHQWLHLYVGGAPHWFNEGLAEYFGIATMTRSKLHYGLVPQGYPSRLHNIRWALTGQLQEPMPLSRLLRADRQTFMGGQAAINYATAWSFVHFMASNRQGRDLLRDYFRALQQGLDLEAAYQQVFGDVDMNRLQASWKDYTLNLK